MHFVERFQFRSVIRDGRFRAVFSYKCKEELVLTTFICFEGRWDVLEFVRVVLLIEVLESSL